ncbi:MULTISPECIES: DNA cytosine methyltransferase [unclassified Azospirillum]|uniref:DNA cytosine methyltransferase n=1 Tax=unclassified Azospirillum TaxID=2630922 RepID=UPI00190EDD39|nr:MULTISPECIES: DNA cytosine methyltransferase [unclassified Azospirillum]
MPVHDVAVSATGAAGGAPLFGLSLCAGACGLDLGLHIAEPGYRAVGYVERDAYAAAVLVARMADAALDPAPVWDDLASFDGRPWRGAVDLVLAGYPCQPFSVAGRRRGSDDPRHLWPHVARIIDECRPGSVFLENVPNHLNLGYREVREDLEGMGFVVAEGLFSAAEVGAPHRRERLFVLAGRLADAPDLFGQALQRGEPDRVAPSVADGEGGGQPAERRTAPRGRSDRTCPLLGDPVGARLAQRAGRAGDDGAQQPPLERAGGERAFPPGPGDDNGWQDWRRRHPDTEPAVRRGADGLAYRVDRLRLCGNGVVPLVAAYAWRTLWARLGLPPRQGGGP